MPKTSVRPAEETSKWLKPYLDHGVEIVGESGNEAIANCPFCGKEEKFYISTETGMWSCKVCQEGTKKGGGNAYTFIRKLFEHSKTPNKPLSMLSAERGMLHVDTLAAWGLRISEGTGEWIAPGYGIDGKVNNLYRYTKIDGKHRLIGTTELHQAIYGVHLFDKDKSNVYLVEGVWNAAALWEALRSFKQTDSGLQPTSNPDASLLTDSNVLGIPGAMSFNEAWLPLFSGKTVYLGFDSDHPKEKEGRQTGLTGYRAMERTSAILARSDGASAIHYLNWGGDGYDPLRESGWDVRDHLKQGAKLRDRIPLVDELLSKFTPIPSEWVAGRSESAVRRGSTEIEPLACTSWEELLEAWGNAVTLTDNIIATIAVELATIISTKTPGSQLWMLIVSPPSTLKTTIAEALSVNRKYVVAKDTFTGFHSGYHDGTDQNHSPIQDFVGKTLIVKDGDNLLSSPKRDILLAELRSIYDRNFRSSFRIKDKSVDWSGIDLTVLINGTSTLYQLDAAEAGARFLVCTIVEKIEEAVEDKILLNVARRSIRNMALESNCKIETQYSPELVQAMRLTGGFVNHLRENANELLGVVRMSEEAMMNCIHFGKFTSFVRARPSKVQDEIEEREFAARLVEQFVRLDMCTAAVLGKHEVDGEVLKIGRKVALDTSRGKTFNVVKKLRKFGETGLPATTLNILLDASEKKMEAYRSFLVKIGVCESFSHKEPYRQPTTRFRLTKRMTALYDAVMEGVK